MKGQSRQGQSKVKEESSQGQQKVKVKLWQHKHNLDLNYNLMGFDTIEINLVFNKKGGMIHLIPTVYCVKFRPLEGN